MTELQQRVSDRARDYSLGNDEIAFFRDIEKALSELNALRGAFSREEEQHQDLQRRHKDLKRRLEKGE